MFSKGFQTVLILALALLTAAGSYRDVALANDKPAVEAEENGQAAEQNVDQAAADNVSPEAEAAAPAAKEEIETAPAARKGALFWDKVLSVVGLHEEKPFKPDQVGGAPSGPDQDYVIGPGDQLGITVWRDDTLTKTVLVLPDGKIQFPLIGEMVAAGKTVAKLKKELEEKLTGYVVDAGLTVEVRQSNSLFVYLIGKINAPGRQMLLANTNVLQALAMAGGLNPFADKDDIRIFRQEDGKTLIFPFRYTLVSAGNNLEENIWLKRGDVIVVP